jgi:signal transduction histidine kinase
MGRQSAAHETPRLAMAHEAQVRVLNSTIEKRERELTILSRVAARVHGEDDVERILNIALDEILGEMHLSTAWILIGDERDGRLRLAAHRGVAQSYLDDINAHGLGECLCPEVFGTGHRMQARNTLQCPRMPHIAEARPLEMAHACIPLKFEGGSRGVLNVAARAGAPFTEEELRFLETLGHQVCLAVERANHLGMERTRNREARALAAITKAIGGSLDPQAVIGAVGETARDLLRAEGLTILLGADVRALTVAHLSGEARPSLSEGAVVDLIALGGQLSVRAIQERTAFQVDDVKTDRRVGRFLAEAWRMGSLINVPLLGPEHTLGLMIVSRASPYRWSEEEVDLAETLAAQASVALENARLYEQGRRAYEDLKAAQARIIQSEKMAVMGTFAAGLAHEVRNPLNSIGLQLSILERRMAAREGKSTEGTKDVVAIIRDEIRRLDALVTDFLLLSRSNRLSFQDTDLGGLVDEIIRLLLPEAAAVGVDVQRGHCGPAIPDTPMDAEKIKQVTINLVRNAIEAIPRGGQVVVETGLVGARACFRVADNGPGLPEGVDVFQLFVSTKPGGTGLGLSIAQQIVLDHGGEITVESGAGRGTTFTVLLPTVFPPAIVKGRES